MKRARILFLEDTAYNCKGDVVPVAQEDDNEIYYYDSCRRWCYLLKSEEGKVYKYVPAGERLKKS